MTTKAVLQGTLGAAAAVLISVSAHATGAQDAESRNSTTLETRVAPDTPPNPAKMRDDARAVQGAQGQRAGDAQRDARETPPPQTEVSPMTPENPAKMSEPKGPSVSKDIPSGPAAKGSKGDIDQTEVAPGMPAEGGGTTR